MRNCLSVFAPLFMLVMLAGISAAWAQTPAPPSADATVVAPTPWFVYGVIIAAFVIALIALGVIRAAIERSQFSLGDALSEEAQVTVMDKDPAGNQFPRIGPDGKPVMMTAMVGSASRVIALMGTMALLIMFLGFAVFVMYYFAMGQGVPKDLDKVVNFMLTGLTLFAPYLVNKFSSIFDTLQGRRP